MAQVAFDTLAYANKLKEAGCDPKLAEVQAEAQAELLGEFMQNNLATKQDIKELRFAMQTMKIELRGEIQSVKTELQAEFHEKIQSAKTELQEQIQFLKVDFGNMKIDIEKIKTELKHLPNTLLIKLGSLMVVALAVMTGLIKLLHL